MRMESKWDVWCYVKEQKESCFNLQHSTIYVDGYNIHPEESGHHPSVHEKAWKQQTHMLETTNWYNNKRLWTKLLY